MTTTDRSGNGARPVPRPPALELERVELADQAQAITPADPSHHAFVLYLKRLEPPPVTDSEAFLTNAARFLVNEGFPMPLTAETVDAAYLRVADTFDLSSPEAAGVVSYLANPA